ncbi:hypothetical protein QFC19_000641 [Naganishia cerealis]|uniref:Uncharacterized protein n=1 Tax=Naganishia cerealis TaxID=610337 RepID=A0ACC2WNF4_9TREE|nr:hypothetical protein QFC19_000641 [Naganishia cerealis]
MFGCIVAGRLVQTNLQQVDSQGTSFVFSLDRPHEVNHLTVFLLGTVPFPDGYGASVHFQYPGKEFLVLGTLTNDRPSAIYRLRPLAASSAGGATSGGAGTLGIQIQPLASLEAIAASRSTSVTDPMMDVSGGGGGGGALVKRPSSETGSVDVPRLAEKIVKNLFNYLHSFEGGPATLTADTPIPLGVFQKWYERFLSKKEHGLTTSRLRSDVESMEKEEIDDIEEFLFCLRPYVFAATQFEITYAPWTLINLPLSPTSIPSRRTPLPPLNTYMTDSTPRSRLVHVPHYGTNKPLCPPILAHAAILNFFTRVDKLFGSSRFDTVGGENGRDLTGGVDGPARTREAREEGLEMDAPVAEVHAREGGEGTALGAAAGHVAGFRPPYTPARRSEIFDTDYKRLRACYDPTESPGMAIEDWVGRFTGCWEGSFSFFDYDAYKSMLSGEPRALYEGQFGEQTQVWRLREVCVRPKRTVTEASESHVLAADKDMEEQTDNGGRSPSASPLNAGFELHSSTFDHLIPLLAAKRTGPLSHLGSLGASTTSAFASSPTGSITSAVVRILESDDDATRDDYLVAMLGGLQGQEVVSEQELEGIIRRRKGQVDDDEDDHNVMDESNDMTTGTQKMHGGEPRDGDDLELMLVGTGHSAWGEFLLRGRVRLWDGMVTLVKEYSVRGYIVGNNVFVGRWRDCVTPQDFVGYEGTPITSSTDSRVYATDKSLPGRDLFVGAAD